MYLLTYELGWKGAKAKQAKNKEKHTKMKTDHPMSKPYDPVFIVKTILPCFQTR